MNTISYKNQIYAAFKEGPGETKRDKINLKTCASQFTIFFFFYFFSIVIFFAGKIPLGKII